MLNFVPSPGESHELRWWSADDVNRALGVKADGGECTKGASNVGRLEVRRSEDEFVPKMVRRYLFIISLGRSPLPYLI